MVKDIDSNIIDSVARLKKALNSTQTLRVEFNGHVMNVKVCLLLESDGSTLLDFIEQVIGEEDNTYA